MIETIYIEQAVREHPRALQVIARFQDAHIIEIDRYGEVFNPRAQNFRLQKTKPALIIAHKHDGFVLNTPTGYGVGGENNYYFYHMLNCLYDCRYCFLQGMYQSAHYVLFVNYEDYEQEMERKLEQSGDQDCWFFSGYDCDSLALEPVSRFAEHFLPFFAARPRAWLELRTKSTQIRSLLATEAFPNAVVAFSFTPEEISGALEARVPSVKKRIHSMQELQQHGWKVGLRFDPLIYHEDYQSSYRSLFETVFSSLVADAIHSVSLGSFRMPKAFYKNIITLYPEEKLYAGPLQDRDGMVSYEQNLDEEMTNYCSELLQQHISSDLLYSCNIEDTQTGTSCHG